MNNPYRTLFAATILATLSTAAHAEPITLKAPNGSLNLVGDLTGFVDGVYTIETNLGPFRVRSNLVTCEGTDCPVTTVADVDFRIAGSDTVGAELMPLLVKGYVETIGAAVRKTDGAEDRQFELAALAEDGRGDTVFRAMLEERGSSTGFRALIKGEADIAMSSRAVRANEVEEALSAGLGDLQNFTQEHSIGVDGLLVVVNHENPVEALAEAQVAALLSGQITNWADVGGPNQPVTVYTRDADSGTYGTIEDHFLAPRGMLLSPNAQVMPGNQAIADAVLADPGAIGYVAFANQQDTKPLSLISECGVVSTPDAFSAKTGEYPLQRNLYLYTADGEIPGHARGLVRFATSPEADPYVRKSGFLDFSVSHRSLDPLTDIVREQIEQTVSPSEQNLMREMLLDMIAHERLSTTFRFRTGSSELDNASQRDLRRLQTYLNDLPDGAEIVFAGFTDSDGSFGANRTLAEQRAAEVRNALIDLAGDSVLANKNVLLKGYGELSPVGCNDDIPGQRLNRRVEIWVRSTG